MTRPLLPVLATFVALALACGGETTTSTSTEPAAGADPAAAAPAAPASGRKPVKFCEDIANLSQCFDTEATTLTEDDCLMAVSYLAKPQDGACPTEGRSGSCQLKEGGVLHYYSTGGDPYDKDKAKEWCTGVKEGTPIKL